ncbi:MAG: tetratricopeptide repeat protein [Planctomycetota bacterium]|jgi:tetratricopeptide (TPR) repeat protein
MTARLRRSRKLLWATLAACLLLTAIPVTARETSRPFTANSKIASLKNKILSMVDGLEEDFPESVEPKVLRGVMFRQFGDHSKAVAIWEEVLQRNPRRTDVLSHLGKAALEMEEYERAVYYWRRALAINPQLAGLRQDTGFALLEAGQYRAAIKELQEELKLSPKSVMSLDLLGQCHLQLKEYEKAKGTVSMRLKQPEKAKEYMARFKELRPGGELERGGYSRKYDLVQMRKGAASLVLGAESIYRDHSRVEKAESLLDWAIELDRRGTIGYMKWQAISYQRKDQHSRGLALIRKLAELEPDDADSQLALGMFSLAAGKYADAEAAFRKTIALAPKLADGYRELARMYIRRGEKPQEALELAKKAVELEGAAENYYILSRAHLSNNQTVEALAAIRKAIELDPTSTLYRRTYDFLQRQRMR